MSRATTGCGTQSAGETQEEGGKEGVRERQRERMRLQLAIKSFPLLSCCLLLSAGMHCPLFDFMMVHSHCSQPEKRRGEAREKKQLVPVFRPEQGTGWRLGVAADMPWGWGCWLRWHPGEVESGLGSAHCRVARALAGVLEDQGGSCPSWVCPEGSPCEGEEGIWRTCLEVVGLAFPGVFHRGLLGGRILGVRTGPCAESGGLWGPGA